ncbi:MAG TPA: cation:dicarboxylase symporter family transporter [Streptosporangiaceae bacterium]|jgi:proton glutamate symport protein
MADGVEEVPGTAEAPRPRRWRNPLRWPIGLQVLVALVAGVLVGWLAPGFGSHLKLVGDLFVHAIEMVIVPLLFPLVVLGITRIGSAKRLGRVALKTILYFEIVTTIVLVIGLVLGNVTNVGAGARLGGADSGAAAGIGHHVDFTQLVLSIVPENIVDALGKGNLLAIVFFSVFFGLAIVAIGDAAEPVTRVLDALSKIMFRVVGYVIAFAPIGVFGFIAYDTATYGLSSLRALLEFVLIAYLGFAIVLGVLSPIVAAVFRVGYVALIRVTKDLIGLAFLTRSTEVVLAPLLQRLERHGVDRSIPAFTLPLGYSFNADGATLYEALGVLFIAHAYGHHLGIGQQIAALGLLIVLTKGIAGVPSAAIVVLFAAASSLGLPAAGVTLLLGVDFIVDMARSATNIVGNSLATVVIAKSEGLFHPAGRAEEAETG